MKKFFLLISTVLFFSSCSTSIQSLHDRPGHYAGRTVTVSGSVDRVFPLAIGDYRLAVLRDETAAIPVLFRRSVQAGDSVRLKTDVIGFSADGIRASRDDFENQMSAVLPVDNSAEFSRRVMNILVPLAETFEMSYLLVEQQ
ncbi:hypothetical protein [Spirochaeta dissipatitropha]